MSWTRTLFALTTGVLAAVAIHAADEPLPNTGMADPAAVVSAFDRFAAGQDVNILTLELSNLRGMSTEARNAGGSVRIDLATGLVTSTLQLMPAGETFDLWLVDNRAGDGRTTPAGSSDAMLPVGRYTFVSGRHGLTAPLGPGAFAAFYPDRAFVVRENQHPAMDGFVLTGSSTAFARLRRRQVRFVDDARAPLGFDPASEGTRAADFARLVAETNPALASLEQPDSLRRLGLILVNADGFDPPTGGPDFVLRAVQSVQALANSNVAPDATIDFTPNGRNPNPSERLGWGNDGAALRDFALVAIAQHAPKSLRRERGVDFRVPTDEELDALAAYQLAVGRQEDFDLPSLTLKSDLATSGKALYLDTGNLGQTGRKNCNACHFNGGGTAAMSFSPLIPGFPDLDGSPRGFNMTAETNANEIPLGLSLGLPRDGGFGRLPTIFGSLGNTHDNPRTGHLELEGFNTPPVVESADTGPSFHNHTVADLESAVAFYGTPAFQASIFARPPLIPVTISPDPNDPEVQAIAAFLRVLNALENIRSSIDVAERGRTMTRADDMRDLARLALAEAIDAIEVLSQGALTQPIESEMLEPRARLLAARATLDAALHPQDRQAIDRLLIAAMQHLRGARSSLVDPATLPRSFRN